MAWTVTADAKVLDELTEIYMDASDKVAVSLASNEIDTKLQNSPLQYGTASGIERILCVPPICVVYGANPKIGW